MHFEFATAAKIVFGPGTAASIPDMAAEFGSTVCLVTGGSPERAQWVVDRSEERRVGKEWSEPFRPWWTSPHKKKKVKQNIHKAT